MNFNNIEFEVCNGYARLALNRPESLNSFTTDMHTEVKEALKTVEKDESIRCLLLTGNGRGFCAGQDLNDHSITPGQEALDLGEPLEKYYNPLIRKLRDLEMPVICAVNGVAAGAGANIALACDIVFAARSANFIQAFSKLGIVPDSGGTWTLPRMVGYARASALIMLGDKVTAEQAEQWGMIWKCVDDEELLPQAEALAKHFATQATAGLAYIKRALQASMTNSLDEQLDLERDLQSLAGRTEDYAEGITAFLEKREPLYKGR